MTTLEILRAARALIDTPEKWIQGDYYCDGGGLCVAGALYVASGLPVAGPPDGREGLREAFAAIYRVVRLDEGSPLPIGDAVWSDKYVFGEVEIADWNDDDERVHAHIMHLFGAAIANEEAREQEFIVASEPVGVVA